MNEEIKKRTRTKYADRRRIDMSKFEILTAVSKWDGRDNPTSTDIGKLLRRPASVIAKSLYRYARFNYVKRRHTGKGRNRYRYLLTPHGAKVLLRLKYLFERGRDLNLSDAMRGYSVPVKPTPEELLFYNRFYPPASYPIDAAGVDLTKAIPVDVLPLLFHSHTYTAHILIAATEEDYEYRGSWITFGDKRRVIYLAERKQSARDANTHIMIVYFTQPQVSAPTQSATVATQSNTIPVS